MRRVLLAWEHGKHLGHMARLRAVASLVAARGADTVWVLPGHSAPTGLLPGASAPPLEAPVLRTVAEGADGARANSFADILLALGYGHAEVLAQAVVQWVELFRRSRPDVVVLDYAPTAQLAAHLLRLQAFQITNGFDAPPPGLPIFGLGMRGPYLERLNAQRVSQLDEAVHQAVARCGERQDVDLSSWLGHAEKVFDCLRETDPYGPRELARVVGPLGEPTSAGKAEWPEGAAGEKRVFAYLRGRVGVEELLEQLVRRRVPTLCFWPDARSGALGRYENTSVRLLSQPVALPEVLPQADAVINYGSTTMVCRTLLAGRPQLMLPPDVEKQLVARRVETERAGLGWHAGRGASVAAVIDRLLSSDELSLGARRIAAEYPQELLSNACSGFVDALMGLDSVKSNTVARATKMA